MYYPLLFHPLDFFGHVVDELLTAEDLDVVVESEHEAAYAEKRGYVGLECPAAVGIWCHGFG